MGPYPGWFWPQAAPKNLTLAAFTVVAAQFGYLPCENGDVENGAEKIVLYRVIEHVDHAARQLANGRWTSKLGEEDDIEHNTADGVCGGVYGQVLAFFSRPVTIAGQPVH